MGLSLGGLIAGASNLAESGLNAWLGHEETQNAQAFAERMASTQYQRTVQDLKAAGLNPMLAYMNTNASPTVASAPAATFGGAAGAFSSVHSAKAAAHLNDEMAKLPESQRKQIDAAAAEASSRDILNQENSALVATQQQNEVTQGRILEEERRKRAAEADSAQAEAVFNKAIGGAAAALGPGITGASGLLGKALDIFTRGKRK